MADARQLIICSDGTNNNVTGGKEDTNVVKMLKLLTPDNNNQVLFYDPGVGNAGELPGTTLWDKARRFYGRVEGLALGRGIYENIAEAYLFLMRSYRPGDQIYFFGFSRGAFTARCIAGLVNQFGILRPSMECMVPTLLHVYFSRRDSDEDKERNKLTTAQIKESFCSEVQQQVPIRFVGVWDTVASVGMPPFDLKITALPTIQGKQFQHVRQALALDEHRAPFLPRPYTDANGDFKNTGQTMKQLWFRGSHCDVGGGYAAEASALSDKPLVWLLAEAAKLEQGLRLCYGGRDLRDESAIEAAWQESRRAQLTKEAGKIHAVPYSTCLWAVAGLRLRDPSHVAVDGREPVLVTPEEHASVTATAMRFPDNTVWVQTRPYGLLIILTLFGVLAYFAMGQSLVPWEGGSSGFDDLVRAAARLPEFAQANTAFAAWQLTWWSDETGLGGFTRFRSPFAALTVDFVFIGCYAYAFSWFFVKAFARMAGLTRTNRPERLWLNRVGHSLLVLVLADVAENLLTLLVIGMLAHSNFVAGVVAVVMSLAAVVKLIALAVVIVFVLLAYVKKPKGV